jgi:hypothetical protein
MSEKFLEGAEENNEKRAKNERVVFLVADIHREDLP